MYHRIQHETDKESIIEDVEKRLRDVKINLWSRVAKELKHEVSTFFVLASCNKSFLNNRHL